MKAIAKAELRIGNFVKDFDGNVVKVTDVGEHFKIQLTQNPKEPKAEATDELFPIPLTENWLHKFRMVGKQVLDLKEEVVYTTAIVGLFSEDEAIRLRFVHELQNLYLDRKRRPLEILNE
jgi:hypothetical protein